MVFTTFSSVSWPFSRCQLGYLLQLTTSAALARHPHASMGLLRAGIAQRTEIFGPKNQKRLGFSRGDPWQNGRFWGI